MAQEMRKGKVKWFNDQKGYGFIEDLDGAEDCFVHFSTIRSSGEKGEKKGGGFKTLKEGEEVEYVREKGAKGWSAVEVFRESNSR